MPLILIQGSAVLVQSNTDLVHFQFDLVQSGLFPLSAGDDVLEVQEGGLAESLVLEFRRAVRDRRLDGEGAGTKWGWVQIVGEVDEGISLGFRRSRAPGEGSSTGLDGATRKTTAGGGERLETRLARLQTAKWEKKRVNVEHSRTLERDGRLFRTPS